MRSDKKIIVVDLDGTLVTTDLVYVALKIALLRKPLVIFRFLWRWAVNGRLSAKMDLAKYIEIKPEKLPYSAKVISYLKQKSNDSLYLVSGSPHPWVVSVANHMGIFQSAWGSDTENLTGLTKLSSLKKNGIANFSYIGDSRVDLPIWLSAEEAVLVRPIREVVDLLSSQKIKVTIL